MSKTYIPSAVRRFVSERANHACEYCLIPEIAVLAPHQIDHVIAEKHGGPTNPDNLALACTICNKHKGSDLASIDPSSGETVRLYRPREDHWHEHFQLKGGRIIPQSAIGRVTVQLLRLNLLERVKERRILSQANVLGDGL